MADYIELSKLINSSVNTAFFGGAGVSTESGIPDFRGNSGLYSEVYNGLSPEEILHHNCFTRHPDLFYDYYKNNMIYPDAQPNSAHKTLAKLEASGKLSAVITQNIDGLHQMAGSERVLELHGSTLTNHCVKCGCEYSIDYVMSIQGIPFCNKCGGIIKPDVVLYGEGLDMGVFTEAEDAIYNADLLIVGGTSLTVNPAASLIGYYKGKHLVIINKTPTPYDAYAELIIREPIGEVFAQIAEDIFKS